MTELGPFAIALGVGLVVALGVVRVRLRRPPPALMRINFEGRPVPAVLGEPVVAGALAGLGLLAGVAAGGWAEANTGRVGVATALLVLSLGIAGRFDDLRGDEPDRGFRGHIRAALGGRLTGGAVKIFAGGVAGLIAGALVTSDVVDVVLTGVVIALSANLFNLLDRAPGRALKLWFLAMIPVLVLGPDQWRVAAAPLLGAAAGVLAPDLRARAMLGDAGVNPLGSVWGLGLALSTGTAGRAIAAAVLLALNLASERYSFSAIIGRTAPLRALDEFGRK